MVSLESSFQGCTKHLECMIRPREVDAPLVTFELGINESTKSLLQGVMRLYRGANRFMLLSIVLNVKELDTEPGRGEDTARSPTNSPAQSGKEPQPVEKRRFEASIYLTYKGLPPQLAWQCVFGSERVYSADPSRLFIPLRRLAPDPHVNWLTCTLVRPQHDEETEILFPVRKLVRQMQDNIEYETSKHPDWAGADGHKLTVKSQAAISLKFDHLGACEHCSVNLSQRNFKSQTKAPLP